MHELSIAGAIVATVERHAGGSPVTSVRVRVGRLRQVVPDSLAFCFGHRRARVRLRGRSARDRGRPRGPPLRRMRARVGDPRAAVPVPGVRGRRRRGGEGRGARGRVHRGRGGAAVHRTRVRVVEVGARRQRHDRAWPTAADFDRAGRGRGQPDERPRRGQDDAAGARAARPRRRARRRAGGRRGRAASTPTGCRACTLTVTQLNTDQGFGGECHLDANMVRSALPEVPLDEIDLLVIENVGNLVCPAEFRVGEDARAMVCSVTEGEDKPLKYPLMFRACELVIVNKIDLMPHLDFDLDRCWPTSRRSTPACRTSGQRPHRRGRGRAARLARGGRGPGGRVGPDGQRPRARLADRRAERRRARSSRPRPRRIARLCHAMAERFARGGRLIALGALARRALGRAPRGGRVRAPGDRRQARPAGDRAHRPRGAGRAGRRWRRPEDIVIAVGTDGRDPDADAALALAARARAA